MEQERIRNSQMPKEIGLMGNLKLFFKEGYFSDKLILVMLIGALAINIANWIVLALLVRDVDFPIILHYNVYFGVDLTGNWKQSFYLPIIGLVLLLVNWVLSYFFYSINKKVASYLVLGAAVIVQINLLVASLGIIIINY